MKNFYKIIFLVSILLNTFATFAQSSDDDTGGGNLDGDDLPINKKLIYLVMAGLIFAFLYFKQHKRKQNIK